MSFPEFLEGKSIHKLNPNDICRSLSKGACVKILNSKKTFQVVGINPKIKICWIREWPFDSEAEKTFSMDINQITLQTFCSKLNDI